MFEGKQKAVVAFVITLIAGVAAWALAEFPDNDTVQQWGAIIAGIVGILGTTAGVYLKANTAGSPPAAKVE